MSQRLAMLAVALVTTLAAPARAQITLPPPPAAAAKDEQGPTTIDAERLDGVGEIEMTARGNAEFKQGDMTVFGDYLKYNRELGWIDAHDGVRLQLGVDRFFGPRLRYNTLDDTGNFETPRFLIQRDQIARGNAEEVNFLGKDLYLMKRATYTTCEPGRNDWQLDAEELELNYDTQEGKAKKPKLKFFDTTVLSAPFAFFPLENSRKSGLLSPYYAHSNTRGLEIGIPYYWNIAPEYDYTLTPVYMTKRGLLLKNEGRYINPSFRGEARVEFMPGDTELQRQRYGVSWQHMQSFSNGFGLNVDYNKVSDDRYFVDLTSQVRQTSIGVLQQDAYVTKGGQLFAGLGYSSMFRVQKFQTLQDPNAPITPPYQRVPQINFSTGKNDIGGLVDASVPFEYVRFSHPTMVEGSRYSSMPTIASPHLAPGWFFTPRAGMRFVNYSLTNNTLPGQELSPHAAIPWMSVDSGLVFDRDTSWFGQSLTQTLEPRLYYVRVPYHNQDNIPIFDTGRADFTFAQLFTENRFAGGDRFGDANQLTAALTTRFLQNNGIEAFRASV
ncbi:MAG: LPS-assembly protein LptD, partial [Betaproteobacteria bacterium]|nr:LPS-assembly protein LptD [Betaproteobacteria bacterium]